MTDLQPIARFLDRYAARWQWGLPLDAYNDAYAEGISYDLGAWPAPRPTVQELAGEMLSDVEFDALELGDWTRTPAGELTIRLARYLVTPTEYSDLELLVAALQHAADAKRANHRREEHVFLAVAGIAAVAFLALLSAASR